MIIQIDTDRKTVSVDCSVILGDFIDTISKMLPDGLWKSFTLIQNATIEIRTTPMPIQHIQSPPWYQPEPWTGQQVWCGDQNSTTGYFDNPTSYNSRLLSGIFTIQA